MSMFVAVMIRATNLFANSLIILLIVRMVLSWVYPNIRNMVVFWVWRLTEPFLDPVRRLLPVGGRFDWSPVVVLVLVSIGQALLVRFFYTLS